jgi:hypothetical protein
MMELLKLRKRLSDEYLCYKKGLITEKEYCLRVKPIDMEIDKLEMSTLQDILGLKGSSLQHVPKPKH